jgi:hypothetical protein
VLGRGIRENSDPVEEGRIRVSSPTHRPCLLRIAPASFFSEAPPPPSPATGGAGRTLIMSRRTESQRAELASERGPDLFWVYDSADRTFN